MRIKGNLLGSILGLGLITWILLSCTRQYQPKPKGYNRLLFPEATYQISPDTLPYQFEYSRHARLNKDSLWIGERYWVQIYYPELHATIHVTYKKVHHSEKLLKEYLQDAYVLTAKHQIRAYAIDESIVRTPSGKTAVIAELDGEVPSQFQFTMTDSIDHFLRGAVYFNVKIQNDSLRPAIEYIKRDAMHMINSLRWKN